MKGGNLVVLFVVLAVGFILGFVVRGGSSTGSAGAVDAAVRAARDECDARLHLAERSSTGSTPAPTTSASLQSEQSASSAASGRQMVEQLARSKGLLSGQDGSKDSTDEPPDAAAPTDSAPPPSAPYPRVLDVNLEHAGGHVMVKGNVKNESSGICSGAMAELVGFDERGVPVARQTVGVRPSDLAGYDIGSFEADFYENQGVTRVSATINCK